MQTCSKIQIGALILALVAMLGQKFELLPFPIGFLAFAVLVSIAVVLGLIGLFGFIWQSIRGGESKAPAIKMFVIALLPLVAVGSIVRSGFGAPPIHDISTDVADPPLFVAAKAARTAEHNSADYAGDEIAQQQKQAYPHIGPINSSLDYQAAFDRAQEVVRELGWTQLEANAAELRIEAFEETLMFGFKDDVVIRVRPTAAGSVIDLRSNSRVGLSDLGANAARIQRFSDAF